MARQVESNKAPASQTMSAYMTVANGNSVLPHVVTDPTAKGEFLSIQFLRAVAVLLVVFMHSQVYVKDNHVYLSETTTHVLQFFNLAAFGGCGVHLFFVISGFIMAYQVDKRRSASRTKGFLNFMERRLTRIVPVYWACTLLWAFYFMETPVDRLYLLKSLFFIPVPDVFPVWGLGWTLNYEMFFYVTLAIVAYLWRKPPLYVALVFGALDLLLLTPVADHYLAQFVTRPIVWEFVGGLLIYKLYRLPVITRFAAPIFTIGVSLLASTIFWYAAQSEWQIEPFLAWGLPSTLIVLGATALEHDGRGRATFSNRVMRITGDSSYVLYLIHMILYFTVNYFVLFTAHLQTWLTMDGAVLLVVAIDTAIACALHYALELPAIRLLRKTGKALLLQSRRKPAAI
jgi:exopolysaccharide production protein ExoZ